MTTNKSKNNNNNNDDVIRTPSPPRRGSRPQSPFFHPSTPHVVVASRTKQSVTIEMPLSDDDDTAVAEHKSGLLGCAANLMTCIVGSGIVGIPYAIAKAGFGAGVLLIVLTAILTEKSLRLLVSTAKHIHVPTYETAAEAVFGPWGFRFILINMFIIAYGAMVTYLMIVKDSFGILLQLPTTLQRVGILFLVSLGVQMPLSCLRDMADLDKTSRMAVLIDILLVGLVAMTAPWQANLHAMGGWMALVRQDTIHYDTIFVGLGVLSFAFECQESAFLVAGSLERPTLRRWSTVTAAALALCSCLTMVCGVTGYIGYLDDTKGNILNNLDATSLAGNVAHGLLGMTMLFVYPLASFVARHVCVVLLFEGQRAHEGDDTSILNRLDRRIGLTVALYLAAILPATIFHDMGSVLALAGTIGGSSLAYIGPGMLYLGVHGARFLELVQDSWLVLSRKQRISDDGNGHDVRGSNKEPIMAVETTPLVASQKEAVEVMSKKEQDEEQQRQRQGEQARIVRAFQAVVWYMTGFPIWCKIASFGKVGLTKHVHELTTKSPHPIRIGDVEYTLVAVNQSGRVDADPEGAVVVMPPRRSESLPESFPPLPVLGKERPSIDQQIGKNLVERRSKRQKVPLEPDPQEEPPTWRDFFIAIFFICFGVVALMAGLLSMYATS